MGLVFVVLGAASNYLVVWGLLAFGPPGWWGTINNGQRRIDAPDYRLEIDGVAYDATVEPSAIGVECWMGAAHPHLAYSREPAVLEQSAFWMVAPSRLQHDGVEATDSWSAAYGVPMVCLVRAEGVWWDGQRVVRRRRESFGEWRIERQGRDVLLPLMPVWRGFIVNTAVYGAAWFGLHLLVVRPSSRLAARLWQRAEARADAARRLRCIKCGYSRQGLPEPHSPCPECGSRQF